MRLIKVELNNWASYKGWHEFDFSTKNNRNGYAIFGNNSRGKTSFSDAIKWAMYGEVFSKAVMGSDGKEIRTKRPLVSKNQEDNPLLNVHSFRAGEFDFMVRITFTHEGQEWILARVVAPDSPLVESDKNLDTYVMLKSESKVYENNEAEQFIFNILPKDINKFFFIDGESVNEYRALIANTEQNLEIRKNIEDILNFPILSKGIIDLKSVTGDYLTELTKVSKDTKKNRLRREKIEGLTKSINESTKILKTEEKELTKYKKLHSEIEIKLGMHEETEKLIERQRGNRKLIEAAQSRLKQTYTDLKNENKYLWLYLLQPQLKKRIKKIAPELEKLSDIRYQISQLNQRLKFLHDAHKGEKIPCATCKRLPEPRDKKQKEIELNEIKEINENISSLNEELENHKQISDLYNSLQEFNTSNRIELTLEYEQRIGSMKGEIEELQSEQETISSMLDGLDDKEINKLKGELNKVESSINAKEAAVVRIKNQIELLVSEKASLSRDLIGTDGSLETQVLRKKIKTLESITKLWDLVQDSYAQDTRLVIQKRATETFKQLTNNPEGYDRLELNSGFGLKIIDADGYVIPAPSPGAQQVVAISLIDALRQTSDIDFPIIFDTPGASIDKEHRDNIISHFWSKRDTQFVILASSGEFRPHEVEKDNKELLAKTWEIDFISGINSTVITRRLGHD